MPNCWVRTDLRQSKLALKYRTHALYQQALQQFAMDRRNASGLPVALKSFLVNGRLCGESGMNPDTNLCHSCARLQGTSSQAWPRRNLWFAAALLFILVGTFGVFSSSVPPEPLLGPFSDNPIEYLSAWRAHLQTDLDNIFQGRHVFGFAAVSWVLSLPLSIPVMLTWRWRKNWLLRILTACAFLYMLNGGYHLFCFVAEKRQALKRVVADITAIQQNLASAKIQYLSRYEKQREKLLRFAVLEKEMNEPGVSSMVTLTTLDELRKRQQRIHEAIAAGEAVVALYQEDADLTRPLYAAERHVGVDGPAPLAQARYELGKNGTIQNLNLFADEIMNIKQRLKICQIHLKMLNLTERIWSLRRVDTKARKVYVDKYPLAVAELNELQEQLRAAQDELEDANTDDDDGVAAGSDKAKN